MLPLVTLLAFSGYAMEHWHPLFKPDQTGLDFEQTWVTVKTTTGGRLEIKKLNPV